MRTLPVEEIRFAGKTGFLSRDIWLEFFTNRSISRNSRVWRSLTNRGYFLPHTSSRAGNVLILNRRNETVVRLLGMTTVSPPFISQLDHDETAAWIALKLERGGVIRSFMTEAEQKRHFFGWNRSFRESQAAKFPDLLLEINTPSGTKHIAVEVELSKKSPSRYEAVFRAYRAKSRCDTIIFLARSDTIFDALSRAMKDVTFPTWERPVGFGSVDDWIKDPARSVIHLSDTQTSLEQMTMKAA